MVLESKKIKVRRMDSSQKEQKKATSLILRKKTGNVLGLGKATR
jgi:hypothetical protein